MPNLQVKREPSPVIKYIPLTKVESGVVNKPSVQTMAKIAKALGVSIEDLI